MGLVERVMTYIAGPKELSLPEETLPAFINRLTATSSAPVYRLPSVRQSLGVPSIQRAVSLISGTTGMLTVQAYRNGAVLEVTPTVVARPDPYNTPQTFYAGTSAQMAKYGEFVWWIAKRDGDGIPASLVLVPLHELDVQTNPKNRFLPAYRWGEVRSTRYSPANPEGAFVHVKYPICEPFDLRGSGPLQICSAATSVTVEAQAWAANFYADGGNPSVVIKHAGVLGTEVDEDGLYEADRLRNQWVDRAHNVPRIVDQNIESIEYKDPSEGGAQMLEARQHQNGEAARMFGIAGSLLEYQQPGSSLTYQNLEGEFTKFVRTCLQPLYLEPIEQALSDLLPRSTVARFNVKGFLRADIRTRFDVYKIAIESGIYGPEYAQQEEGIAPGDVEFNPVPFAPPSAIPTPIARAASSGMRDIRCPKCRRLIIRAAGPVDAVCHKCKTAFSLGEVTLSSPVRDEPAKVEVHNHFPPDFVRIDSPVTVHTPDVNYPEAPTTLNVNMPDTGARMDTMGTAVRDLAATVEAQSREQAKENALIRSAVAENTKASAAIAKEIAIGNKPRTVTVLRDPKTNQIRQARTEVA